MWAARPPRNHAPESAVRGSCRSKRALMHCLLLHMYFNLSKYNLDLPLGHDKAAPDGLREWVLCVSGTDMYLPGPLACTGHMRVAQANMRHSLAPMSRQLRQASASSTRLLSRARGGFGFGFPALKFTCHPASGCLIFRFLDYFLSRR